LRGKKGLLKKAIYAAHEFLKSKLPVRQAEIKKKNKKMSDI